MRRSDNVLVLTESDSQRLVFSFRTGVWSLITLIPALGWGAAALFLGEQMGESARWAVPVCWAAFALFLYSTVYSLFARLTLEINGRDGVVQYRSRSLYRQDSWMKPFSAFDTIRLIRGQHANYPRIILSTQDEEIPLALAELGKLRSQPTEDLARRIAEIMGLEVVEERLGP
ncbi:MAG: hypothetical protein GF393_10545 [Armatimonadia bacterium]|nr:hypothetical protein [Armatimonadia bacterium]